MKKNGKKYLIYLRYALPILSYIVIAVMLFVPSHRFIFSGKAGELMSVSTLISNSWEQARNVLFGAAEQTDAALIFSRWLLAIIIVSVLLLLLSLAVSVWSAIVAFRYFLSDDEESAYRSVCVLRAFVPNRIILCILSSLGITVAVLPYFMTPLYAFTYSQNVTAVLEAPDALTVGGLLVFVCLVLSAVSAAMEKELEADIFKKNKKEVDAVTADGEENEREEIDTESKERIRRLFDKDGRSDKK